MSPVKNPQGSQGGINRVIRGGSWCDDARGCRAAIRYYWTPSARNGDNGFRLVLVPKRKKT